MRIFDKERRAYRKMLRRHRRELVGLARKTADFDYEYLDELVITKIRHMYEYYTSSNNVWQSDDSLKKVIDTLKTAIDKYAAREGCLIGEEWRDAPNSEWHKARWVNGMFAAVNGHIIPEKTVICGHWHCSYGHSKDSNGKIPEFGNGAVFEPYYSSGIIAIDACTAASGKVNVIKIEDEDL